MSRLVTLNSIFSLFSKKTSASLPPVSSGPTLPQNTVMFWASDATSDSNIPSGFSYFQEGDGRAILSTTSGPRIGSLIPTNAPFTESANIVAVGNTGAISGIPANHTGPSIQGPGASPFLNPFAGFAGTASSAHTHTSNYVLSLNFNFKPTHKPIPAIKTVSGSVNVIPQWSVVFSEFQPSAAFSRYSPNAIVETYVVSRQDLIANVTSNALSIPSVSTTGVAGVHSHPGTISGGRPRPRAARLGHLASGGHTHNSYLTVRTSVPVRHLSAWIANETTPLPSNIIVMYSGTLESLPSGWRVCDGNNTILMNNTFIGHNNTTSYIAAFGATSPTNSYPFPGPEHISVLNIAFPHTLNYNANTWTHNHIGNPTTATRPFSPTSAYHGTRDLAHTHDVFSFTSRTINKFYEPNAIILAFITNQP